MCADCIWKRPYLAALIIILCLTACGGEAVSPEPEAEPEPTVVPTEAATEVPPTPTTEPTPSPVPTLTATEQIDLGLELWEANQLDEALVAMETAVSLEPNNPDPLANLGGILITLDRYDEAIEYLNQAYEIDETHKNTQVNLCTALAVTQAENALDRCEVAALLVPESHNVPNALGIISLNEGSFEDAIQFFEQSIDLGSDDGFAHNNLGYTYMQLGQFDIAIEKLEEAVIVNPLNTQALYNRGLAYAQAGQMEKALDAYNAVLVVDSTYDSAYFDRALVFIQLDRPTEAIADFETFLTLSPNDSSAQDVLAEIAYLQGFAFVEQAVASPETLDFANPASVVQTIFYSAANKDFTHLASLCDPDGQNDGDTALVCEVTPEHERADEFIMIFANGSINGPVTISGEIAEIPFLFGENGDVALTMKLVLRDGKWYLFEF